MDVVFSLRRSGQLAQPANAPLNRKAGDLLTYEPWVIWVAHRRASYLGSSQTSWLFEWLPNELVQNPATVWLAQKSTRLVKDIDIERSLGL